MPKLEELHPSEKIKIQPLQLGQKEWASGKIIKQVGIRSYEVEHTNSATYIQNREHLRKFNNEDCMPNEPVTASSEEQEPVAEESYPHQHEEPNDTHRLTTT